MSNVHFSPGFRRTDAAGQLCTLGTMLSVSKVTLSSDIMGWDTLRVALLCCIEIQDFSEGRRFLPMCSIWLCSKSITTVLHTGFLLLMHPLGDYLSALGTNPSDKPWKQPAAHLVLSATR